MKVKDKVREAAVAGAFYPSDKEGLSRQNDGFLADVSAQEIEGNLRILIVPHAGYSYSGQVAAFGFKQLQGRDYSRIILVGGSHQARFPQAAVDGNNFWQTPLGKVPVDTEFVQKLIDADTRIIKNLEVHAAEHSLEVELPFLQSVLERFKIVPILLGDDSKELAEIVADALGKLIDDSTLIVISTDLSHYPMYEDANRVDKETIDAILTGKVTEFERIITEQMVQGVPNLATCACGEGAVKVGMLLAKKLGVTDIGLLKYANSGDISGDRSRVVGYAAIGFYGFRGGSTSYEVEPRQKEELLRVARQTLERYLTEGSVSEFKIDDEQLNQYLGAFITLRKNGQLRGCIGEFEQGRPLWQVVREKTIDAAIRDPRFTPVTADELPDIKIEVSVLSPKEKISDPRKISLGKHGVVVKKGLRSGIFLPQVATDTGWDLETFLGQLCSQKAGLPWDCWKDGTTKLYTFTAQVFGED